MVFEKIITIECFSGSLTIATNGLQWVFYIDTIAFNNFLWSGTIGQTMRWFRWIVVVYRATCSFFLDAKNNVLRL